MRKLLILLALPISLNSFGQIFHIDDTVITLVKTTDHSPVHWYSEIFNDIGVDSTLRWRAEFNNVPSSWVITFDDQSNYHSSVQDNDSADFTLLSGLSFPQKLIIGAILNGATGTCDVTFHIYDPNNPSDKSFIRYEFIVTQGTIGVEEFELEDHYSLDRGFIVFDNLDDYTISLIAIDGRLITSTDFNTSNRIYIADKPKGTYLIKAMKDGSAHSAKIAW